MQPIERVLVVYCEAARADVWRYLANTELLNRFIGSGALETEKIEDPRSASRFVITGKISGLTLRYREEPWQWTEGRFFAFLRDLENGPATTISLRYELADNDPSGSIVTIRMSVVPRSPLLRPVVALVSAKEIRQIGKFVAACDAWLTRQIPLQSVQVDADPERVATCLASLSDKYTTQLIKKFHDHICTASDFEVVRMRPFELARSWQHDRDEVVKFCFDAVGVGLLDLTWCIICPSCQTVSETLPSLRDVARVAHCHSCDLVFGMDLTRSVEAVFVPHPTVRQVEMRPFCIAGPMLMPHVLAQRVTRPDAAALLDVCDAPGRYRLFARGGRTAIVDVQPGNAARVSILLRGRHVSDTASFEPMAIDVAPGGQIEVRSEDPEPCQVKFEQTRWNFDALTALHVSALPEFRAQFGGEALRPGLALKVGKIAIYFSDLCGSTALYSEIGDAAAFGVVTDCLTYGSEIVKRHGGIVVKTMGDAVMAAFPDTKAAMAAGAASISEWAAFRRQHALATKLDIKVGVAAGPCTIVTANGVLDYFGQTVNSAARIQHLAGPGQFVAPRELTPLLEAPLELIEQFDARVKGISQPFELTRFGAPMPPAA